MRQVHHFEKLIDILVRNTSTGEVSPEVMRVSVLNCTSLIKRNAKMWSYASIFFLNVFKDYTKYLFILCLTTFRNLFIF